MIVYNITIILLQKIWYLLDFIRASFLGVKIGIGFTTTVCVHRAVQLVTDKFVIVPAVGAVPPVAVYVIDDDVTELTV